MMLGNGGSCRLRAVAFDFSGKCLETGAEADENRFKKLQGSHTITKGGVV